MVPRISWKKSHHCWDIIQILICLFSPFYSSFSHPAILLSLRLRLSFQHPSPFYLSGDHYKWVEDASDPHCDQRQPWKFWMPAPHFTWSWVLMAILPVGRKMSRWGQKQHLWLAAMGRLCVHHLHFKEFAGWWEFLQLVFVNESKLCLVQLQETRAHSGALMLQQWRPYETMDGTFSLYKWGNCEVPVFRFVLQHSFIFYFVQEERVQDHTGVNEVEEFWFPLTASCILELVMCT